MTEPINGNLYQFTEMKGKMSLPMHQYLLASGPSVLFATGSCAQAEWILPEVVRILGGKPLGYLFVSHFESCECGGLGVFKKKFPDMTVICSNFMANELPGFGYRGRIVVGDEGRGFEDGDIRLRFFRLPVEVHHRDGLLTYEENTGTFFTSDLVLRDIKTGDKIVEGRWENEVASIDSSDIHDDAKRERLKSSMLTVSPKFVATGCGPCVRCVD